MHQKLFSALWLVLVLIPLNLGCSEDGPGPDLSPIVDQFRMNDGVPYTVSRDVTVTVIATDDVGVADVMVSEDAAFTGASWQDYQEQLEIELSTGDGVKTLYARVRDGAGGVSETVRARIVLAESTTIVGLSPYQATSFSGGQSSSSTTTTTCELWIANVTDMFSAVFLLSFDPNVAGMEVSGIEVDTIPEHILKSTGASLIVANADFDNDAGEVRIGVLPQQAGFEGVSGSGPFARISFAHETFAEAVLVEFVEGEWSQIWQYRDGEAPGAIDGVVFIDGELEP